MVGYILNLKKTFFETNKTSPNLSCDAKEQIQLLNLNPVDRNYHQP